MAGTVVVEVDGAVGLVVEATVVCCGEVVGGGMEEVVDDGEVDALV